MPNRYYYNILSIPNCEDTIQWEMHCSAINSLMRYALKGLHTEYQEDKHVDFNSNEAALLEIIGWCKQLKLIEVQS